MRYLINLAKRLTEKQKKIIISNFKKGESIEKLSREFHCTNSTIVRNLKKNLGEVLYKKFITNHKKLTKNKKIELRNNKNNYSSEVNSEKSNNHLIESITSDKNQNESENYQPSEFIEISPLNFEIENIPRKELSSVPIENVEFPKIVYMIVDKNIELQIKLLKEYPEWEFLPTKDLNRKTIEIYADLKTAKRLCNKDQKVLKVPNSEVFRIVSPILISRGISRIISAEKLIAL